MLEWNNVIFYLVFTGQILLISGYFAGKIHARMAYVIGHYPADQFPKLYPRPVEYYRIGHAVFKLANRTIMLLGFVILGLIMFVVDHASFADDGYISEFWPAVYGMIQMVPTAVLEFSELNQLKKMRELNIASTRTAQLQPRNVFRFVSPWLLATAVGLVITTIVIDFYLADFALSRETIPQTLLILAANGLFAYLGVRALYGPKQNPHQSHADRNHQIKVNLRSFINISIAGSLFLLIQSLREVFPMAFLDAVVMSLYFQAIVVFSVGYLLRHIRVEDVDFTVYREVETAGV